MRPRATQLVPLALAAAMLFRVGFVSNTRLLRKRYRLGRGVPSSGIHRALKAVVARPVGGKMESRPAQVSVAKSRRSAVFRPQMFPRVTTASRHGGGRRESSSQV